MDGGNDPLSGAILSKSMIVRQLERETWYPNRGAAFAVEHVLPKSDPQYEHLKNNYTNLVYACSRCNSLKGQHLLIDPTQTGFASHVVVRDDGLLEPKTKEGEKLIDQLHLNLDPALATRRDVLKIIHAVRANPNIPELRVIFLAKFRFPEDLPDLRSARVENDKPDGINNCYFEQRKRGVLPEYY
jgi:hypothetical protein